MEVLHTWFYHQRCFAQTRWRRIMPEDIGRIPDEEIPQRWKEQGGVNAQKEREFELIRKYSKKRIELND